MDPERCHPQTSRPRRLEAAPGLQMGVRQTGLHRGLTASCLGPTFGALSPTFGALSLDASSVSILLPVRLCDLPATFTAWAILQ